MPIERDPNDPYGFEAYKNRSGQEWSLNIEQQKALFAFFEDMSSTIYDELYPLADKVDALENLPDEIRREQNRVLRNLRKYWEYVADNFNTIGVPEDELQGPAVNKEA
jgi:L-lactate utilization protein LutB